MATMARTAQHSTAQHIAAQHSTAQHSTAQHSTAAQRHSTHPLGGMPASALSTGVNSVLACTRKAPRVAVVYDRPAICVKLAAVL